MNEVGFLRLDADTAIAQQHHGKTEGDLRDSFDALIFGAADGLFHFEHPFVGGFAAPTIGPVGRSMQRAGRAD